MVEGWAQPVGAMYARREKGGRKAEIPEQRGERTVELVTEPAPMTVDDLVDQRVVVEHDRLAQVDAQVLEWHRQQVAHLQLAQCVAVGVRRPLGAYAGEVT